MIATITFTAEEDGIAEFRVLDEDSWELGWFNVPAKEVTIPYLMELAADTIDHPELVTDYFIPERVRRRWGKKREP